MRPLFPPWSDTVFRVCLFVAASGVVGAPVAMILWARTPYVTGEQRPVEQPIAFDHRHHVRDDGIDCLYCHYEATRSKYAGVPPTSVCMGCHSQVWQDSSRLAPVRESWFGDHPIRWRRVHQLPGFVYFDHSAHTSHGVDCVECHGEVDQMAAVQAVSPLTMQWCLDCHRNPGPHLLPGTTVAVDPPVSCTGCHR